MRSALLAGTGGVLAAFLGSLCCMGPLLFVALGVGAGLASSFEPLRPILGTVMLALFAFGFWTVYRPRGRGRGEVLGPATGDAIYADANTPDCAPGAACAVPTRRRRDVAVLWTAAVMALGLWTFPTWSVWLV